MKHKTIVIDSLAQDVHAYALAWTLEQLGIRFLHIFGNNFPSRATIDLRIETSGRSEIVYRGPEGVHRLTDEDDIVFLARRCAGPVLPAYVVDDDRGVADRESTAQLRGMRDLLASFDGCITVNDLVAKQRANRKPLQLRIASQCGMSIPLSLFSNDSGSVRDFVSAHPSGVIYKTNTPVGWQRTKASGGVTSIIAYSHMLQPEEVPSDQIIRISSGIYQFPVPKRFEVRVTAMGSACLGSKLYSQESPSTAVDWRAGQRSLRTERIEVPQKIASACTEYLRRMGLVFGCFDFVITPDDEWVFLECNEQGQWLWQEAYCPDLPLLDAYTQFICNPSINFRYKETERRFRFSDYQHSRWVQDWREARERHVIPVDPLFSIEGNAAATAA